MATLWFAPRAALEICENIPSFASGQTIQAQVTAMASEATYSAMVKNVRISGGERDVDTQKLIGFNELMDEKRATIIEATFTTAYQGSINYLNSTLTRQTHLDMAEMMMGTKQSVAGNYMRSTGGEKSTLDRIKKAVHFKLTDGTYTISILLNSAYMTSRELSLDAEGHMEQTVTFKCLASTYYEEDDYTD